MANVSSWATSFLTELLRGYHALGDTVVRGSTAKDTIKAALYYATGSLGPSIAVYTTVAECTGGGYTAGGVDVSNANNPSADGNVAVWGPSASIVYSGITQANVNAILMYNSTQGNRAIGTFTFPAQTLVAGTLTLSVPVTAAATALFQLRG